MATTLTAGEVITQWQRGLDAVKAGGSYAVNLEWDEAAHC